MKTARLVTILTLMLLAMAMASCSAEWHLVRAKKKRPDLFEVKTDTIIREVPVVKEEVWLDSLELDHPEVIYLPVVDSLSGRVDTVKLTLTRWKDRRLTQKDSMDIRDALTVEVDCPDSKEIIKEVSVPVPVEPNFWKKLTYAGEYLIYLILLLALILFVSKRLRS